MIISLQVYWYYPLLFLLYSVCRDVIFSARILRLVSFCFITATKSSADYICDSSERVVLLSIQSGYKLRYRTLPVPRKAKECEAGTEKAIVMPHCRYMIQNNLLVSRGKEVSDRWINIGGVI
jgi:hypothetical protein